MTINHLFTLLTIFESAVFFSDSFFVKGPITLTSNPGNPVPTGTG